MALFPIFLKLEGRRCLVVGAGKVALEKITTLLPTGAALRVIAPEVCEPIAALAKEQRLILIRREFQPSDLEGQMLVVTATNSREVNHSVFLAAQQRGLLCNSADDPPNCDFYFASTVQRGDLQIAISTAGESPALAQQLRREIDEALPSGVGPWLKELGELRREVLSTHPAGEERKALLHTLAQLPVCASPQCPARQLAHEALPAAENREVHPKKQTDS